MIIWMRTANIQDGKMQEAFAWAVKVSSYLNKKFPEAPARVMRSVGGPLAQIRWIANYESLASYEKIWKQIEADEGYRGLVVEARQQGLMKNDGLADSLSEVVA